MEVADVKERQMKKVYAVANSKRIMSDLTRGKQYPVLSENKEDFMICTDKGIMIRPCWKDSASLHGEDWERLEIEDDEMPRTFENLDKPLPDGTIPFFVLFDMAVKQVHESIKLPEELTCSFGEDLTDITSAFKTEDGIKFRMIIWKKDWHICFYSETVPIHCNKYPLYQKLFDWGFLKVNK